MVGKFDAIMKHSMWENSFTGDTYRDSSAAVLTESIRRDFKETSENTGKNPESAYFSMHCRNLDRMAAIGKYRNPDALSSEVLQELEDIYKKGDSFIREEDHMMESSRVIDDYEMRKLDETERALSDGRSRRQMIDVSGISEGSASYDTGFDY